MMIPLIKEVGRGKRGARDLSYDDAKRAADMILSGESTPVQTGAFLMAQRVKMESSDEILAFVDALRERSIRHPVPGGIDCAGPYDGRSKSFMATIAASFVTAACGVPVTLHGGATLPPKLGITLQEVMQHWGVQLNRQDTLIEAAAATGLLFVPSELWCPPLAAIRPLREELGLRTIFNTAEKLIRFSDSPYLAIGVYHGTVFEKMTELLQRLGIGRGLIIQGSEGSEDAMPDRRSRAFLVTPESEAELTVIDPELYDLHTPVPERAWTAVLQAEETERVLKGDTEPAFFHMVLLNSAIRLWTAEAASSIEEGLERSLTALRQGAAYDVFRRWLDIVK
jgi:anthranilate phosphoribosyltransferase